MNRLSITLLTTFLLLTSRTALAAWEDIAKCSPLGTTVPNVGVYVSTSSTANFLIGPDQCLRSANGRYVAVMQKEDGNFVVYDMLLTRASGFISYTAGHPGAAVIVQNDGHFVVYAKGGYGMAGGTFHGDPKQALQPFPAATLPVGSYFLAMEDDGGLRLYAGAGPGTHLGLIWSGSGHDTKPYCFRILNATGRTIDKPITLLVETPVNGFRQANRLFEADKKGGASFAFANGECKGS